MVLSGLYLGLCIKGSKGKQPADFRHAGMLEWICSVHRVFVCLLKLLNFQTWTKFDLLGFAACQVSPSKRSSWNSLPAAWNISRATSALPRALKYDNLYVGILSVLECRSKTKKMCAMVEMFF